MAEHKHLSAEDLPRWACKPMWVCFDRLENEVNFLHLTMRGLAQLRLLPKVLGILQEVKALPEADGAAKEGRRRISLDDAEKDATWVTCELEQGFPLLHAHSVVGVWSALEVLCEDFAVAWLTNVPEAWSCPEVAKLRLPISLYNSLSPDERPRFVIKELARTLNADLRKGVGKLKSLLAVFGLAPAVGPNLQKSIHELYQVRNVIVHCGSRADQKFIDECPWFGLAAGELVTIDHQVYGWYYRAARRFGERVLNQAFLGLKLPGCECPGMDEIEPRPLVNGSRGRDESEPNPGIRADC
jgi:hypothetical protein